MDKNEYNTKDTNRLKGYLTEITKSESKINYMDIKNILDFLHRDAKNSGAGMGMVGYFGIIMKGTIIDTKIRNLA